MLPYYNPVALAKYAASLDQMSGGRVVLGVGVGAMTPEFEALGIPMNRRGSLTNESMDLMRELWANEDPRYRSERWQFADLKFSPKPLQRADDAPHVPLWVGGSSPGALRRAARRGDGWHPSGVSAEEFAIGWQRVRELAEAAGRASTDLLKAGEIDITQSGISRSFMDLDAGSSDPPLHVAEINQRDGFFLLSKTPTDNWRWADLAGATLIPVGFTAVPYTTLQAAMRWHGVDPASVNLLGGLSAEEMLGRFRDGDADYLQVPNPFAAQLIREGSGHLAATLGNESGYVCYSSFAVTPAYLADNSDTVQAFVNGYARAQRWVADSPAAAVAERIAGVFPEYEREVLTEGVQQYKDAGVWATDPAITRQGFDRMRDALMSGGLVREAHPYESIVRPEFAERAAAELA